MTETFFSTLSGSALSTLRKRSRQSLALAASLAALAGGNACMAQASYDDWYNAATAATKSPAVSSNTDQTWVWTAPDGRSALVRVRQPVIAKDVPITLGAVPAGADARPYFEKLVADAIKMKATRLIVPAGTYTFKTVNPSVKGQWAIVGLSDALIQGSGARLVFNVNDGGIYISNAQRVRLTGFTLDYGLHTTSFAQMVNVGGQPVLQIDPKTPVTAADGIGHLAEYNKATLTPDPGDLRIYTPNATDVKYIGNQQYTSPSFAKSYIGKTFLVYHHYYGGTAIKIMGDNHAGAKQTEDVTIDSVTIRRSPGFGIMVYGVKRGVAITNSQIVPSAGEAASTEYDAIHTVMPGGDLGISNNTIWGAGDDNINVDAAVTPVLSANGTSLNLGNFSYFMQTGDTLAAFDSDFKFLGMAKVAATPTSLGSGNYNVQIDKAIPGLGAAMYIRDLAMSGGRAAITKNTITNGGSNLIQVPNAMVSNNKFTNTGVRILSNIGTFKEGLGGMNVLVDSNSFQGAKVLNRYNFPHGAITTYGVNSQNLISTTQLNRYLAIRNNVITNMPQSCITVGSAYRVEVTGNSCQNVNTVTPGGHDINLINVTNVALSGNKVAATAPIYTLNATQVH